MFSFYGRLQSSVALDFLYRCLAAFLLIGCGIAASPSTYAFCQDSPNGSPVGANSNLREEVTISLLTGDTFQGTLLAIQPEHWVVQQDGQQQEIPRDQVAELATTVAPEPDPNALLVQLSGGTQLRWTKWSADRNQAEGRAADPTAPVQLPGTVLQWVRMPSVAADDWTTVLENAGKEADAVVVQKGNNLDWLDGIVRSFSDQEVSFSFQKREATVPASKVAGLVFFHPPAELKSQKTSTLTDIAGQHWVVSDWTLQAGELKITTAEGLKVSLPWSSVAKWSFADLRFLSLSAREPDQFQWSPLVPLANLPEPLARWNAPRRNVGYEEQILQIAKSIDTADSPVHARQKLLDWLNPEPQNQTDVQWEDFEEGLAMKLGSEATYTLQSSFQRLTGRVGLAPPLSVNQAARIVIRADQKVVLDAKLDAQQQPAMELDLALESASRLTIAVQFAPDNSVGDVVHFGRLRLLK